MKIRPKWTLIILALFLATHHIYAKIRIIIKEGGGPNGYSTVSYTDNFIFERLVCKGTGYAPCSLISSGTSESDFIKGNTTDISYKHIIELVETRIKKGESNGKIIMENGIKICWIDGLLKNNGEINYKLAVLDSNEEINITQLNPKTLFNNYLN